MTGENETNKKKVKDAKVIKERIKFLPIETENVTSIVFHDQREGVVVSLSCPNNQINFQNLNNLVNISASAFDYIKNSRNQLNPKSYIG